VMQMIGGGAGGGLGPSDAMMEQFMDKGEPPAGFEDFGPPGQ